MPMCPSAVGNVGLPPEGGVPPNTRPRGDRIVRRLALVPLTVGVLLFPSAASALGLGEIEMQSALNQRLDAEIPLRGVPADEADRIIVSLASEEAFRQVGLQRPFALTRLQFRVRQHDSGRHFIHVTTRESIVEPFLSFLIEVDWPDGNLLREYTVLLDPPVFVSEREDEPAIADEPEAPAAADEESITATGVPADIERDTETEAIAEPEPAIEPGAGPEPEAAEEPETVAGDFSDTPVFLQVEQEEERAESEARHAEEEAAEAGPETVTATATGYEAGPDEYGPVQRGEALWNIAARLKRDDMTVQQMMLALLRYNPEAFVDDNVNRLRQGYVLRVPDAGDVLSLSAQQAVARVREHNALWQEFRTATRTGATTAPETETDTAGTAAADADVAGGEGALEIVGSDEGTGASTDESATATSDRDAGQAEDLRLAREQLESARMEKAELESRVDELEETVSKMERLIEVREDQLAKLQEQLQQVQQDEEIDETGELVEADEMESTTDEEPVAEETGGEEETGTAAGETDDGETDEAAATGTSNGNGETGESVADDGDTQTGTAGDEQTAASSEPGEAESGVVTVRTQPEESDWLDKVGTFWDSVRATVGGLLAGASLAALTANPLALPIAGGAAVLLLLGGLLIVRRRRAGVEEEVLDSGGQVAFAGGMADDDDQFNAMLQSESDEDMAVDEEVGGFDEADDIPAFDAEGADENAESALMSEEFDLGDLDEEEDRHERATAASGESEDETIAEADVYLAYGLHQQAEELLKLALQEQPDRLDYHAKMLETLYGAGKTEEFVEQAEAFRDRTGDPNDRLWLQTVAMGKELAPDSPLFQQEVDKTLKPADSAAAHPPGTDFEIGGEEEDATDLDFSFDDDSEEGGIDEQDDDAFAQTVMVDSGDFKASEGDAGLVGPGEKSGEAESGDNEAMDFDLGDFSLDTPEEEPDEGSAAGSAATESAGSDEDLEFDLGDLDMDETEDTATTENARGEAESADAGEIEFDLGADLAPAEEDTPSAPVETDDTGLADMDLGELEGLGDETGEMQAGGETAAAADTEEESFDFDLGDLEKSGTGDTEEAPAGGDEEALDLGDFDFDTGGAETSADTEDEATIAFDTDDDASLNDLESDLPADESGGLEMDTESGAIGDEEDVDTMLDLARAYIDMGDSESARATLEEVAEAGNDKQRGEAQSLLESV